MDELIRHCLQELAFDGDLGCDISRLRDFVCEFYSSHTSMRQNLDDAYHAFVWSLVTPQPSVQVGVLPEGQTAEVYVPPQPRKGKNARDGAQGEMVVPRKLELIPDAKHRPLDELLRLYGNRLRIAVDPGTCFVAITGSHAKSAKLTPMVYASLQLISRSREAGISVLELGRATGYDQKTCFYVVKQLLDLDLIVKLRQGGNSQNFCVHKYFFDRSTTWKTVREKELQEQEATAALCDTETAIQKEVGYFQLPHFDPIDTRHLTSLTILRQRLTRLLKHSSNETQPYSNISVRIGFRPRSRTDRRFFIARLKELINEGTIEKFFMTSLNPDATQNKQLYLRLAPANRKDRLAIESDAKIADDDEHLIENLVTEDCSEQTDVKSTVTLHRQIIDFLQDSSASGATLNQICDRLGSLDKRTLELLMSRMERQPPPPHLADLTAVQVLETHGRERRYRFFTLGGYSKLALHEGFQQRSGRYSSDDVAKAGGFMHDHKGGFYETHDDLQDFYREWSGARAHQIKCSAEEGVKNTIKSPKKMMMKGDGQQKPEPKKKWTNPILPDGKRKRGRPPKDPGTAETRAKKRAKSASADSHSMALETNGQTGGVNESRIVRKRKRGEQEDEESEPTVLKDERANDTSQVAPKRKRGRPPKKKRSSVAMDAGSLAENVIKNAFPEVEPVVLDSDNMATEIYPVSVEQTLNTTCNDTLSSTPSLVPHGQSDSGERTNLNTTVHEIEPVEDHEARPSSFNDIDLAQAPSSFDNQCASGVSPAMNHSIYQDHSLTLLGSAYPLQLGSNEHNRQYEINDEVTRVIASLAAQINETASAEPLPSSMPKAEMRVPTAIYDDHLHVDDTLSRREHLGTGSGARVEGQPDKTSGPLKTNEIGAGKISIDFPQAALAQDSTMDSIARQSTIRNAELSVGMSRDKPKSLLSARSDRKANLSAMRRENELVQLIENAGGVMNTSTNEFNDAFLGLIQATVKAGDTASAPIGARLDRRTLKNTLEKLMADGRIKLIATNLQTMGGYRNAKIAYLPDITEDRVKSYIAAQGDAFPVFPRGGQQQVRDRAEKIVVQDPNSPLALAGQWLRYNFTQEAYHERWHKNIRRAESLFSHPEEVIRQAMLMEKQTLSQAYGYLTGKIARARELHLQSIDLLESGIKSEFIVSSQERIVSWPFFVNDISLAVYCACVSSPVYREDIRNALSTEEGRMKLKDLPDEWKQALQIGRARSRDRILDLLDYFYSLKLAIPLKRVATLSSSELLDAKNRSAFEEMPTDWASKVPLVRPEYWQLCIRAPIYLFALQLDPAPCWKHISTSSRSDAAEYWTTVEAASLNKSSAESAQEGSEIGLNDPYAGEQRVATSLRRPTSWTTHYTLSWYQTQYLSRFINVEDAGTPLQDLDPDLNRLERISRTISAPIGVVRKYYDTAREKMLREIERSRQRKAQQEVEKKQVELKLLLAKKGFEPAKLREAAWNSMVEKVHPGLVKGVAETRLRKLRQSYVQGNVVQDNRQWEQQISDAIQAAEKMRSSRTLFPKFSEISRESMAPKHSAAKLSHFSSAAQGKEIVSLIDMQQVFPVEGDAALSEAPTRKKESRDKAKGESKARSRRKRFQWNADYDELARDAYAILRARCHSHHRLEWSAIDQVLPSVPRQGVRARVSMLKEQPGADAYLQRLENCWYDLWIRKRGTDELPDESPENPINFNLKVHLEYLRKYVDKNAIRVGNSTLDEAHHIDLPANLEDLESSWRLEEHVLAHSNWDFLSSFSMAEEYREKLFLESAFVLKSEFIPEHDVQNDQVYFAESALKMVVGSPNESYNSNQAAALLHALGESEIETALDNLLMRNVLAKLVRDPSRLSSGRTVKISELNQNALGGPIAKDLFSDACQLEESYEAAQDQWGEWPLTSSDGDTAALLQMFSDHKVEFDVDTSHARATRPVIDGNSRKVDDDDIELSIQVKLSNLAVPENPTDEELGPSAPDASGHGTSYLEEEACCSMRSDGVIDCLGCIEDARAHLSNLDDSEKAIAHSIVQCVDDRQKEGISIEELRMSFPDVTADLFDVLIHRLHTTRVPQIFLVGYSSTIAVSAKFVSAWTLSIPGEEVTFSKVFPRRWLDITGGRVTMVWEAGLRAITGLVHLRPFISQAELRWRLRAVYDRREIVDLLNHLMTNGILKVIHDGANRPEKLICIDALTTEAEKNLFWTIPEDRTWYRVF